MVFEKDAEHTKKDPSEKEDISSYSNVILITSSYFWLRAPFSEAKIDVLVRSSSIF